MENQIKYRGFRVEYMAMLSNQPSYFSMKRWERRQAFRWALICHVGFILWNFNNLSPLELLALVAPLYLIAGYNMNKTEKEKSKNPDEV